MITGIILAVLSIVLLSKFFTKRAKGNRLDKLMIRIHKPLGVLLIVVGIIHLILTWSLLKQRPISMFIFGFIMIGCAFLLFISYLFRKKLKEKWIIIHRVLSLVLFICLIAHTIIGFSSFKEYKEIVGFNPSK